MQDWLSTILAFTGWTLFGLAILAGIALDMLGLFGNWIILAAVAGAMVLTGFEHFGWWTIGILAALAVLGEILEAAASGIGAAKFGGSKGSIGAALAGCLLGAVGGTGLIPIPIIGTLIGACAGAFLAAALYEYLKHERAAADAAYVGVGAALGKVGGLFLKTFVGFVMLGVAAWNF